MTNQQRAIAERFWAKVEKTDGCWEWTAFVHPKGYGMFGVGREARRAHRVSYEIANGPIPDGLCVCHSCDNRRCVRPDHLFLGTNQDNVDDKMRKGRGKNLIADAERTQTHCLRGHEYTPENTVRYYGKRSCRECRRAACRRAYARRATARVGAA